MLQQNAKMTGAQQLRREQRPAAVRPCRLTCYASEARLTPTARVPKRQDLEMICDTIVDEVADAAHVQAADLAGASTTVFATDTRLLREEC